MISRRAWCESCAAEVGIRLCALHEGWCDRWYCSRCGHEVGTSNEPVLFPKGEELEWIRSQGPVGAGGLGVAGRKPK